MNQTQRLGDGKNKNQPYFQNQLSMCVCVFLLQNSIGR